MAITGKIPAPPPFRAWEAAAAVLASLLALGVGFAESLHPYSFPDPAVTFLALLSLLFSATLFARRSTYAGMLVTFLPLLPLAAAAQVLGGAASGASIFAAAALAFQGRVLLLLIASFCERKRALLAGSLLARLPGRATVFVDNDIESEVEISRLFEGHLFRLSPGQAVPADGMVTFGSGFVDESFTAQENLKLKGMGSYVLAGSINKNGTLLVRATGVGDNTFLRRLARRVGRGTERKPGRLLAFDAAATLLASALLAFSGPAAAALAFLPASGAACMAVIAALELGLARIATRQLWLWADGGLSRLAEAGMLVLRAEGVLSEGRLKLVATEVRSRLSEDAVLGLLGPLARKLEGPSAFAVLQELRARNIPLMQVELFQARPDGGLGFVGSDEVRWIDLKRQQAKLDLGELSPFVEEHLAAGEEVHLLEREGKIEAALAFRDSPVEGAPGAVEALRQAGLPILLVSSLPKRVVARLQTELGVEHAQGECGEEDTDTLFERLRAEGLAPAWVQASLYRPLRASAIAATPAAAEGADFASPDLQLPYLAAALSYARHTSRRFRSSLTWVFGCQAGLTLVVLGADRRIAALLGLGRGWALSPSALALASLAPAFLLLFWLKLSGAMSGHKNV